MHRFYISPAEWQPDALVLKGREHHHCTHVLRLRPGAEVTVFNGRGELATARISSISSQAVNLECTAFSQQLPTAIRIVLAQGIPKGKLMEWIIQKATELGVAEIVPVLSEHGVVQTFDAEKKQQKWEWVAIDAAKQCGQNELPTIRRPQPLHQFLKENDTTSKTSIKLLTSLNPEAVGLKKTLRDLCENGKKPEKVLALIGPEGDFTSAEAAAAKSSGYLSVSLGPRVLRTETAALYILSALAYEFF